MTVDGYKSFKRPCHIWLIYGIPFKSQCLFLPLYHFLYLFHFPYFSCRFLNPIKFSNLNSNVLDLRNLQEQVKKKFSVPKNLLSFHLSFSSALKTFANSRSSASSFSWWLEQFILTVGQNNFETRYVPFLFVI